MGFAILEFDVDVLINLITAGRYPITLIIADAYLNEGNLSTVVEAIDKAHRPATLIFEGSTISNYAIKLLAKLVQEVQSPVTLTFRYSNLEIIEPFVKAMQEARAPVHIIFDEPNAPNTSEQKLYIDASTNNFVVDARLDPSNFLKLIKFSTVKLMLERVFNILIKEAVNVLSGLIQSYIGDADLAWIEILAIRSVEGASDGNQYASINYTVLRLRYLSFGQGSDKNKLWK